MAEHIVKTHPVYFDAVKRGDKRFEIRRDDRGYQKGDILIQRRCREDRPTEVDWFFDSFPAKHHDWSGAAEPGDNFYTPSDVVLKARSVLSPKKDSDNDA